MMDGGNTVKKWTCENKLVVLIKTVQLFRYVRTRLDSESMEQSDVRHVKCRDSAVNQALARIIEDSTKAAFHSSRTIAECLAGELMNASKGSNAGSAIEKKEELDRLAKSHRQILFLFQVHLPATQISCPLPSGCQHPFKNRNLHVFIAKDL
jgi:ribosomal protein S7